MDVKDRKIVLLEFLKSLVLIIGSEIILLIIVTKIVKLDFINNTVVFVMLIVFLIMFLVTPIITYLLTNRKIKQTKDNKILLLLGFAVMVISLLLVIDPFGNALEKINTKTEETCDVQLCSVKEKPLEQRRTNIHVTENYYYSELYLITNFVILCCLLVQLKLKKKEYAKKEKK